MAAFSSTLCIATDRLRADLRHAARALARRPAFTLPALATLALGIGGTTAMFSITDALLLRPLPYPDPGAIVTVATGSSDSRDPWIDTINLQVLRNEAASFESVAAYSPWSQSRVVGSDGSTTLSGRMVSPAVFTVLRATPHLGRLFVEDDARAGADQVVLLSFDAWTSRFGSDLDIVGTSIALDSAAHTVVGVLPDGFYFPTLAEEFWKPLVIRPPRLPSPENGSTGFFSFHAAIARLRAGVSPTQAAAEASVLLPGTRTLAVAPLRDELAREYRPALLALTWATALVLLIACINVSGLLLARGVTRRQSLAICAALGAGRGRLVGHLLGESLLLGLGGGAVGVAVAGWLLQAAPALAPGSAAWRDAVALDGQALFVALGLSLATGLMAGVVPALQCSRLNPARALHEGGSTSTGGFRQPRANRAWGAVVVGQVAVAVVLLVGAGLLLRSFVALVVIDRGYDPGGVVTARLSGADTIVAPGRAGLPTLIERLDGLTRRPGVEAAGLTSDMPLVSGPTTTVEQRPPGQDEFVRARVRAVSAGYFRALGMRVQSGRVFTDRDTTASPPVAVINETLSRGMFGGDPAVGRQLRLPPFDTPLQVIGVVADVREVGLDATERYGEVYLSLRQPEAAGAFELTRVPEAPFVAVRTTLDTEGAVTLLGEAVASVNPYARLDDVQTLEQRLSASVASPRFHALLSATFSALALLLAATGIYGLLSYVTSERRREMGLRLALGARRGDILSLVVGRGAALVVLGLAAGIPAAAAATRLLESFLFGIAPLDGGTFLAVPLVVAASALLACWLPAWHVSRVDPATTLRAD